MLKNHVLGNVAVMVVPLPMFNVATYLVGLLLLLLVPQLTLSVAIFCQFYFARSKTDLTSTLWRSGGGDCRLDSSILHPSIDNVTIYYLLWQRKEEKYWKKAPHHDCLDVRERERERERRCKSVIWVDVFIESVHMRRSHFNSPDRLASQPHGDGPWCHCFVIAGCLCHILMMGSLLRCLKCPINGTGTCVLWSSINLHMVSVCALGTGQFKIIII